MRSPLLVGDVTLGYKSAHFLLHVLHPCGMQATSGSLSIPRLCLALGNLGWADPGSFDLGPGEEEVSLKPLQSHFLQTSFQPRALHSPLPALKLLITTDHESRSSQTHMVFVQSSRRGQGGHLAAWASCGPRLLQKQITSLQRWMCYGQKPATEQLAQENNTIHRDVSTVNAGEEKPFFGPNKCIQRAAHFLGTHPLIAFMCKVEWGAPTVKAARTRKWGWVIPAQSWQTPLKFMFPTRILLWRDSTFISLELHFLHEGQICSFFKNDEILRLRVQAIWFYSKFQCSGTLRAPGEKAMTNISEEKQEYSEWVLAPGIRT